MIIPNSISKLQLLISELIKKTKSIGVDAIIEAVTDIKNDNVNIIENDDNKMTYFSFPTKEDVKEFRLKNKKFF